MKLAPTVLSVFFLPMYADACSCIGWRLPAAQMVQINLDMSDVVFLGKVEFATTEKLTSLDFNTGKILTTGSVTTTTFRVLDSWLGRKSSFISLRMLDGFTCGYTFEEGATYLVFGSRAGGGYYSTSNCMMTSRLEHASETIKLLNDRREGNWSGESLPEDVPSNRW